MHAIAHPMVPELLPKMTKVTAVMVASVACSSSGFSHGSGRAGEPCWRLPIYCVYRLEQRRRWSAGKPIALGSVS
jgi:hypothetical protein